MDTLSLLSSIEFTGDSLSACVVDQSFVVLAIFSKLVVVSLRIEKKDAIGTFLDATKLTLAILEFCILAEMDDIEAAESRGVAIWIA